MSPLDDEITNHNLMEAIIMTNQIKKLGKEIRVIS